MKTKSETTMAIQPKRLKNLFRSLVDIYSPPGKEEEIITYVETYLKDQGLPVIRQKVDDGRCNLIVLPDKNDEIDLCFIGHLDTVIAHDLDDYGFREEDGIIYGLGTADMKAGCAAMIEAYSVMTKRKGKDPPVGLALVVGEEEDSLGAKTLIREYNFPWAIVGEPTNMMPCLGHYAYLEVLLRTRGKRAHSSMPELGRNAIDSMLKLLLRISEYTESATNGLVYNIRELSGFPGGFVVPDTCEAWLDIHLPPNSRMDVLKTELEQLVETASKTIRGLDAYLRFVDTYAGYHISEHRVLIKKLKTIFQRSSLPWKPQDFRSHSDGNILWAAGVDPIILGPGRLEEAHNPEESVPFSQVVQAAQLYLDFALALIR